MLLVDEGVPYAMAFTVVTKQDFQHRLDTLLSAKVKCKFHTRAAPHLRSALVICSHLSSIFNNKRILPAILTLMDLLVSAEIGSCIDELWQHQAVRVSLSDSSVQAQDLNSGYIFKYIDRPST